MDYKKILSGLMMLPLAVMAQGQPKVGTAEMPLQYVGDPKLVDQRQMDGQLRPVVGTHNFQIFRANRGQPPETNRAGNTYNHAPMLAHWQGKFYVQYLAHQYHESDSPTETYLMSSPDAKSWSPPIKIFPAIEVEAGLFTIAHQRMGFYVSQNGRLLTLSFYGLPDKINNGLGLGRAVREIYADGTFGPIYFIRYNAKSSYAPQVLARWYPFYKTSPDPAFVKACDELLDHKLMTQQWWEEDRSQDGFYALADNQDGFTAKGLSFFHRKDGKVVGLWKEGWAALSSDEGKSWSRPVRIGSKPEGAAKAWGQRLDDGTYTIVYNPSGTDLRLPLAMLTSEDGITFGNLRAVHGDVPPPRFSGRFKDIGAQYVRGIAEGNGNPPDSNLWVVYSVNKEDLWLSKIPIQQPAASEKKLSYQFDNQAVASSPEGWNIYQPYWTKINVEEEKGNRYLLVQDDEPYDYAKIVKVFPEAKKLTVQFTLLDYQNGHLEVDITDGEGRRPIRIYDHIAWDYLLANHGRGMPYLRRMEAKKDHRFKLEVEVESQRYSLWLNDELLLDKVPFCEPVKSVERLEFRTGAYRLGNQYSADNLAGKDTGLPGSDQKSTKSNRYKIDDIKIDIEKQ
jgi:hypothetical protein